MKVKPSNEIENKNEKKIFIDFFKEHFDIKENIKNIKIYLVLMKYLIVKNILIKKINQWIVK